MAVILTGVYSRVRNPRRTTAFHDQETQSLHKRGDIGMVRYVYRSKGSQRCCSAETITVQKPIARYLAAVGHW